MQTVTSKTPHPLIWVAGIAIILFCTAGIAALMGWLPSSTKTPDPATVEAPAPTAQLTAPLPPVKDPATSASAPANTKQYHQEAPKKIHRKAPETVANNTPLPPAKIKCNECGVIEDIRAIDNHAQGSGLGAVGGAVVGGVLGHQVGGGRGQDVATVAGALGGAYAGNEIEKKVKASTQYEIAVRYEDGSRQVFTQATVPAWRAGDHVKVVNGEITSNNY